MLAKWLRLTNEVRQEEVQARFQELIFATRPNIYDEMFGDKNEEEVAHEDSLSSSQLTDLNDLFESIGKTKTFSLNDADDEGWI